MAQLAVTEKYKRFYFNWVPDVFFRPRLAFKRISAITSSIWITPLLILSVMVLANALSIGRLKNLSAMSGEITYPPDFQYYTPEQQAQYTQAVQSTQGPVFVYVLPSVAALIGIWLSWLILGGVLHLVTTLFGGRGSTVISMNIVAWASLPLALRLLVQFIYMLATKHLIINPGLSGFSPQGESGILLFLGQLLRLIDIYIIWEVLLLILGVRYSTALNTTKSTFGVLISVVLIMLFQAGLAYAAGLLGNLSIARPFFF
jgi:hypothetical protein